MDPHTATAMATEVAALARAGVFDTSRERHGYTAEEATGGRQPP